MKDHGGNNLFHWTVYIPLCRRILHICHSENETMLERALGSEPNFPKKIPEQSLSPQPIVGMTPLHYYTLGSSPAGRSFHFSLHIFQAPAQVFEMPVKRSLTRLPTAFTLCNHQSVPRKASSPAVSLTTTRRRQKGDASINS